MGFDLAVLCAATRSLLFSCLPLCESRTRTGVGRWSVSWLLAGGAAPTGAALLSRGHLAMVIVYVVADLNMCELTSSAQSVLAMLGHCVVLSPIRERERELRRDIYGI